MTTLPHPQTPTLSEQHARFASSVRLSKHGRYEIVAISAGDGNGWKFTADALQQSLPLWDGRQVFVDHAGWFEPHSVRDLGGVVHSPRFEAERQAVVVTLQALGPSGALIEEVAKDMLDDASPKPNLGFSADILFTANGKEVKQILRVLSLDLVVDPARGGAFLRALNQKGAQAMNSSIDQTSVTINQDVEAVRTLLDVQREQEALAAEAEKARAVRQQMCAYLLDSGLAASRLPAAMQEHVRLQFKDKVFEPGELTAAIESARELVSKLTASSIVRGPGQVNAMFSAEDQLQAAVDDLFGAPRDKALEKVRVHKLSGIRELYDLLTGDHDRHGGYYPDRVQLATTADFTGLVKNALNKIVVNRWDELGRAGYDWWMRISVVEHFTNLNSITGTLVGTVGDLPTVAEGADYTELLVGDSPETASFTKYGGYIPLTLELIDRDETRKLAAYPRELASAGLRKISKLVAALFTDNAGVGPTLADTGALFNSTAVTTAGGHANLLTTALTATQWDVVQNAVYDQPMLIKNAAGSYGTGPTMAVNPRYLLVPRELQLSAMKIIYPTLENAANIYSENQQRGQPGDVITVPEWTDASDFAAVVDPRIVPAIFVGERFGLMPEVFIAGDQLSPAVFMNDEHRLKVRHLLAVWVNDFRPLHKSNVA